MLLLLSALIVAAAVGWAGYQISRQIGSDRRESVDSSDIIALFAPGIVAAASDPRALLAWQPLAATARKLFSKQFALIDEASGAIFPFSAAQIQDAHARWTADWLAWERTHDTEYKLKAATAEHELGEAIATPYGRARLDAIEREKLDRYQRRYEEYTRTARALQAMMSRP